MAAVHISTGAAHATTAVVRIGMVAEHAGPAAVAIIVAAIAEAITVPVGAPQLPVWRRVLRLELPLRTVHPVISSNGMVTAT